jgi:thioredoxin 1
MKTFNVLLISVLISIASLGGYSKDFDFLMADNSVVERKAKLIIFSASWCGPCRSLKNFLIDKPTTDVVELVEDYELIVYDFDKEKEMVNKYGVRSIPVMIVEKNDKEVARIIGYNPSKTKYFLDKYK